MRARSREFRAARAFLDRLRAPVLAVPGNHDITSYWLHERFLDPLGRWRRFIAEEPEPVWADGEIAVVGVNTASRAGAFLDWSQGRVGAGPAAARGGAAAGAAGAPVPRRGRPPPVPAAGERAGHAPGRPGGGGARRLRRERGAHDPLGPPAPGLHAGARRGGRARRPRAARRGRAAGAGCWWCRPPPPPRRGCAASRTPTTGSGSRAGGPPWRCAPGTGAAGPPSDPLAGCPAGSMERERRACGRAMLDAARATGGSAMGGRVPSIAAPLKRAGSACHRDAAAHGRQRRRGRRDQRGPGGGLGWRANLRNVALCRAPRPAGPPAAVIVTRGRPCPSPSAWDNGSSQTPVPGGKRRPSPHSTAVRTAMLPRVARE